MLLSLTVFVLVMYEGTLSPNLHPSFVPTITRRIRALSLHDTGKKEHQMQTTQNENASRVIDGKHQSQTSSELVTQGSERGHRRTQNILGISRGPLAVVEGVQEGGRSGFDKIVQALHKRFF